MPVKTIVNDNGTLREAKEIHAKDGGSLREIKEGWAVLNGQLVKFFEKVEKTVDILGSTEYEFNPSTGGYNSYEASITPVLNEHGYAGFMYSYSWSGSTTGNGGGGYSGDLYRWHKDADRSGPSFSGQYEYRVNVSFTNGGGGLDSTNFGTWTDIGDSDSELTVFSGDMTHPGSAYLTLEVRNKTYPSDYVSGTISMSLFTTLS